MSVLELSCRLGIDYSSPWFMAHRIRFAMERTASDSDNVSGIVEADETYMGGRAHGGPGTWSQGQDAYF